MSNSEGRKARKTAGDWRGSLSFAQGIVPLLVAIVVLYIFWSLVKQMMGQTKAPELEWSRSAYLYAGVEAIAYAAAGFLFGREVHRQRAEQAEERAEVAQKQATEATEKAVEETVKGQTLKQVINAKRSSRNLAFDMEGLESTEAHRSPHIITLNAEGLENAEGRALAGARRAAPGRSELDELSEIADKLFP
jgi:hypothetical protein